jgi:Mg-chelatase subunit ChlD
MEETDWKPSRLHGAIESASAYVEQLVLEDLNACVALIQYSSMAKVIVPLTSCRDSKTIHNGIKRIRTSPWTNITSGLIAANDICSKCPGTKQVILLSDGCHNKGPDPRPFSDQLRKYATIECVGIGGSPSDVDEELMRYIASTKQDGTKRYRWIGTKEGLMQHFRDLGGGLTRS